MTIVPWLCSGLIGLLALFVLTNRRVAEGWLDRPNERSLHVRPVPRTGGVAIALSIVFSFLLIAGVSPVLILSILLLAGISLLDDRRGLNPTIRFGAHILAAGLLVWTQLSAQPVWIWVIAVLITAWMTNLYNFMDGSDGLAGGMAVIGFGTYAAFASYGGGQSIATMAACVAAASLAFLCFNYHPARIFMGDVGSIPLGFLAAALGIEGWQRNLWPAWFPVVVFSPFIVDATVTLLRRLLRGERVWQAHREHYYQRLVLMGWGHLRTFYAEVALMLLASSVAFSAMLLPWPWRLLLLIGLSLVFLALALWVDTKWSAFSRQRMIAK